MYTLKRSISEAVKGRFTKLREWIFPGFWLYKASLEMAMPKGMRTDARIHRVVVIPGWTKLHYFIRLGRPGIFIGRKGADIQNTREELEAKYKRPVEIHLREYDPFWD